MRRSRRQRQALGPALAPSQPRPFRGVIDPDSAAVAASWTRVTPKTGITSGFNVNVIKTEIYFSLNAGTAGQGYQYWTINPANEYIFPWLSTIAPCFEQYYFNRLQVEYIPTCNYIATGTVTMAFLYDANDSIVPTSMLELSQYEGAVTSAIRTPCTVAFDRRRCQFQKWQILSNGVYVVDRTSVPAFFEVVVNGATPDTPLGQLRISYDVALCNTQFPERPLSLRSAVVTWQNMSWPAIDNWFPTPTTIYSPQPNVPGWITFTPDVGFTVRGVDEVNMYMFAFTAHEPGTYLSNGTTGSGYPAANHPIDVLNATGGKFTTVNEWDEHISGSEVATSNMAHMFIDLRRPAGSGTDDWVFKIVINALTHVTFDAAVQINFNLHISQAVN